MFGLKEPVHFLSSYPIIISTSGHNVIVLLIQFPMYCESIGKQKLNFPPNQNFTLTILCVSVPFEH